jgi:hypothetical protein
VGSERRHERCRARPDTGLMPVAFTTAPIAGAVAVILVTFIGGMIWGWQVQRDRTVAWAMGQNVLYLITMSLFVWE